MKNELKQYAEAYASEVKAYDELSEADFIKTYIDKDYKGHDERDYDYISEYFDILDIQHYKSEDYSYFEICLTY